MKHCVRQTLFIIALSFMLLSVATACEKKESYWTISKFYKEGGGYMRGINLAFLESVLKSETTFMKRGDSLSIAIPAGGRTVPLDSLFALSSGHLGYDGKPLVDSIYFAGIENGMFRVKYHNRYTGDDDKRTVFEFREISKEEYDQKGADYLAQQKEAAEAISSFHANFEINKTWLANPVPTRKVLADLEDKDVVLKIPEDCDLMGELNRQAKYDRIDLGSASKGKCSDYYFDQILDETRGRERSLLYIVYDKEMDQSKFDLKRYMSNFDHIVEQTDNSFVALDIAYDFEEKKVEISNMIFFKYLYVSGMHIIYDSGEGLGGAEMDDYKKFYEIMKTFDVVGVKKKK